MAVLPFLLFASSFQLIGHKVSSRSALDPGSSLQHHDVCTRCAVARAPSLQCTEGKRERYVPAWSKRGSDANNVYEQQQSEYEAYAQYLKDRDSRQQAPEESVSRPPPDTTQPGAQQTRD